MGFPLAGIGGDPTAVSGSYWSSSASFFGFAHALSVTPLGGSMTSLGLSDLYSVRCVRVVSSEEFVAESVQ